MNISPTALTFGSPAWLWALLLLVPAAAACAAGAQRTKEAVDRLVSPRLRRALIDGGGSRRSSWLRFALLAPAFAALVLALARPQWGEVTREVYGEGRNVLIAIDTSRSMLAEDLKPDRLTQAKLAALDLVDALPEDLIGLMAFSGTAFLQVPMTSDRSALSEAIEQLDTYAVARGGTNLSSAIKLASSRFENAGANQHALILFTDGEDLEGQAIEEARRAAAEGTAIVAVGVGSAGGAIIPNPDARGARDEFVRDPDGEIVRSKLDTETLEKIARASDGLFIHLDSGAMNAELVRRCLARLDTTETGTGTETVPVERYPLPLGVGLALLAISTLWRSGLIRSRRSAGLAPPAAALLALLAAPPARGGPLGDAMEAYADGEFETAAERYGEAAGAAGTPGRRQQLQLGLGSAAYRAGDHNKALDAFGKALVSDDAATQEHAHYGLGNTLFRAGEQRLQPAADAPAAAPAPPTGQAAEATLRDWRGAARHYESALALNPDNGDAAHNLDVVRRRIDELERQQQENQEEEQKPEDGQDDKPPEDNEGSDEEKQGDPGSGDGDDQEGDGEQNDPQDQDGDGEQGDPQDQEGDGEQGDPQDQEGDGEQGDPQDQEGDGEQGDPQDQEDDGEQGDPQDQAGADGQLREGDSTSTGGTVDPETGYSEQQARRQIEALADEQGDLRPLRRRRASSSRLKDW